LSRTNSTYQASPQNFFPFSYEETIGESAPDDFLYVKENHLGNVLVVVSDRKLPVDINADNIVDYYTADVVSATDYYAFGMLQPGRNYSSPSYRYGFNGKEDDRELNDWQDYGMRMYMKRLGRFASVDPITKQYPELTPYQFASNRPIDGIDLDGLEYAEYKTLTNAEKSIIFKPTAIGLLTVVRTSHIGNTLTKNRKIAEDKTKENFGDNFANDESDAFRHALFNALNTQSLGEDLAKELGDAHEKLDDPEKLKDEANPIKMDLFNNAQGREIGKDNPDASVDELTKIVEDKRNTGELRVLQNPTDKYSNVIPSGVVDEIKPEEE